MCQQPKLCRKISIITWGTRGDIQPYVAIGVALRDAGYHVRFLTGAFHKPMLNSFGLEYFCFLHKGQPLVPSMRKALADGDSEALLESIGSVNITDFRRKCIEYLEELITNRPDILIIGQHAINSYFSEYASSVLNIPTLHIQLQGWLISNRSVFASPEDNVRDILRRAWGKTVKVWDYMDEIMSSLPGGKSLLSVCSKEKYITNFEKPTKVRLVCQSPLFQDILYHDINPNYHFIGAAFINGDQQNKHNQCFGGNNKIIEEFILADVDQKPVCCGWGSMIWDSPKNMIKFIVQALQLSGQRGIVVGGWANLSIEMLQHDPECHDLYKFARENVLVADCAQHENIFPRVACVIHHGGAGTTNCAMRSGVPSIVTPVILDQFDHAYLVSELRNGVGFSKHIKHISPYELASAIKETISNEDIISRSTEIGKKLRKEENGTIAVVSEIKKLCALHV